MEMVVEEMRLRGFSPQTIKAYSYHINDFIAYCGIPSADKKREYILHHITAGKEPSTIRLASAAIDFYLRIVLKQNPGNVAIPKQKKKLPEILTKQQILKMIDLTTNPKHKLSIELIYSTGMRLSEILNLKFEDIDFEHGTVRVSQGKGAKDRMTIISKKTLEKLPRTESGLVFSGRKGKYSKKSIQLILRNSATRAGILQKATPHSLRHSFATHLLESGIDIRYIQALLGHENLRTTQIYTRVAKNKLEQIKSPLDF